MISAYQSEAIKTVKGFKNLFNPNKLTREGDTLSGVLELYYPDGGQDGDFKYYIPPGTTKCNLSVVTSGKDAYANIRLGAEFGSRPNSYYDVYADYAAKSGCSLTRAKVENLTRPCVDNKITLIDHDSTHYVAGKAETAPTAIGDWLYVHWMGTAKQVLHRFEFTVNAVMYEHWYYNDAVWDVVDDIGETVAFTDYVSYTGFYDKINSTEEYYSFTVLEEYSRKYNAFIRVFVPPGVSSVDFSIMTQGNKTFKTVARYNKIPNNSFSSNGSNNYTISKLRESDCVTLTDGTDTNTILTDSFYPGFSTKDDAGWLYVHLSEALLDNTITNRFSAKVHTETYNAWYDKYIGSESRWNTYIENVEKFENPDPIGGGGGGTKPADVVSLTGHYGRATVFDAHGNTPFGFEDDKTGNLTLYSFSRVFVPPGTVNLSYYVLTPSNLDLKSVSRFKHVPNVSNYTGGGSQYSLEDLTDKDCVTIITSLEGTQHYITPPNGIAMVVPLSTIGAGWMYTRFNNSGSYQTGDGFDHVLKISVNAEVYNAWYDEYIKDEAGWQALIEDVEQYVPFGDNPENPLSLDKTTIDFGEVKSGEVGKQSLKISNDSVDEDIEVSCTPETPFAVSGTWPLKIAAGEYASIDITFSPTDKWFVKHEKTLTFIIDGGYADVTLKGTCSVAENAYKSIFTLANKAFNKQTVDDGKTVTINYTSGTFTVDAKTIGKLRFFIPVGATGINISNSSITPSTATVIYSARIGAEPTDPPTSAANLTNTGFTVSNLAKATYFGASTDGTIPILGLGDTTTTTTMSEMGWLYVKLYSEEKIVFAKADYVYTVKGTNLATWFYNSVVQEKIYPVYDIYGDPTDDIKNISDVLAVSPGVLDFVKVTPAHDSIKTVKINNYGDTTVTLDPITAGDFSISAKTEIAAGKDATLSVVLNTKSVAKLEKFLPFKDNASRKAYLQVKGQATSGSYTTDFVSYHQTYMTLDPGGTLKSFKSLYNITDANVLANAQGENSAYETLLFQYNVEYTSTLDKSIRIYIPTGTIGYGFSILAGAGAKVAAVSTFRATPTATLPTDFSSISDGDTNGTVIATLEKGNFVSVPDEEGYLHIVTAKPFTSEVEKGGWLYVQVKIYDSTVINYYAHHCLVNTKTYKDWYTEFTEWDDVGDPEEGSGSIVETDDYTITPSPYDFGYVEKGGSSKSQTFTFSNNTEEAVTVSITHPTWCSLTSTSDLEVDAMSTKSFNALFKPPGETYYSDYLKAVAKEVQDATNNTSKYTDLPSIYQIPFPDGGLSGTGWPNINLLNGLNSFKEFYNVTNSKLFEYYTFFVETDGNFVTYSNHGSAAFNKPIETIASNFRIYIAPGCVRCNVAIKINPEDKVTGAMAWNTYPTMDDYEEPTKLYTMKDVANTKDKMFYFMQEGTSESITPVDSSFFEPLSSGGWLCFVLSNPALEIDITFEFKFDLFKAWYTGEAKFDDKDDPIPTATVVDKVIATAYIRGRSVQTEDPDPNLINTPTELANEYAQQYINSQMSISSLESQKKKYESMENVINNVSTAGNDSLRIFTEFNLTKVAGEFGSYGVSTMIGQLDNMLSNVTNGATFYKLGAEVYSAIGSDLDPGEVAEPPGYDKDDEVKPDKDDPESIYQLKKAPDYHMKYRRRDTGFIYPKEATQGDLIMLENDNIYIMAEESTGNWYPVGMQEWGSTCGKNVDEDYDRRHINCEADEIVKKNDQGKYDMPEDWADTLGKSVDEKIAAHVATMHSQAQE